MTFGKRQLLIGALVVALGAAVYLNWQFSGTQPVSAEPEESSSVSKQLGQTVYVNTEISDAPKEEVSTESSVTLQSSSEVSRPRNSKLSDEQQEFFDNAVRERSQANETALNGLKEIIEAADNSDHAKLEAVEAADVLTNLIKAEVNAEAEIKTKGFDECMVSVNNGNCTVIVTEQGLNDATVITIKDIINRQLAIDFDKITITSI